jgi:uncharacterized protein
LENFPAITDYILVLIFGVVLPFVSGVRSAEAFRKMPFAFDAATRRRFYLGNSLFLGMIAAVIVFVWWLYNRPFADLGFIIPAAAGKSIQWWMIALFGFLYAMDIIHSIANKDEREKTITQLEDQTPFMPSSWKDMPAYTVMCMSAGIFEEIVFRGYMVTFFRHLFDGAPGSAAWAVVTPALVFSLAHYYQGPTAVFKILVLSLLFGMIFWHSSSLYAVIVLHFLVDFIGGVLSIYLDKKEKAE